MFHQLTSLEFEGLETTQRSLFPFDATHPGLVRTSSWLRLWCLGVPWNFGFFVVVFSEDVQTVKRKSHEKITKNVWRTPWWLGLWGFCGMIFQVDSFWVGSLVWACLRKPGGVPIPVWRWGQRFWTMMEVGGCMCSIQGREKQVYGGVCWTCWTPRTMNFFEPIASRTKIHLGYLKIHLGPRSVQRTWTWRLARVY